MCTRFCVTVCAVCVCVCVCVSVCVYVCVRVCMSVEVVGGGGWGGGSVPKNTCITFVNNLKGPCKRTQHCGQTTHNIVRPNTLRPFAWNHNNVGTCLTISIVL